MRFAEASAPVEAHKLAPPTVDQVDAHPDAAFIWSVILATRRDVTLAANAPRRVYPIEVFG
jgi:hypothetical protein